MAFSDGLHNAVDIYFYRAENTDRTSAEQGKVSEIPDLTNVPCRIIKDEKAIIGQIFDLPKESEIRENWRVWRVLSVKTIYGKTAPHHLSAEIERKGWVDGS